MKNKIAISILDKQIKSIEEMIEFDRELDIKERKETREYIRKIKEKIKYFEEGNFSVSYTIKNPVEKTKILDIYITQELDWFGSSNIKDIEESALLISKTYNIPLEDSLKVLDLSDELMFLKILSPKEEIEEVESKILKLINREKLSEKEYSKKYISYLEQFRTTSKEFSDFLDFLIHSLDYGVISSFCESDYEDYGKYRSDFEFERINYKDFIKEIK